MKRSQASLIFIIIFLLSGCNTEHDLFVAYKMNPNAEYHFTTKELKLVGENCILQTIQKKTGSFESQKTQKIIAQNNCVPFKVATLILEELKKDGKNACDSKALLLSEGSNIGEKTQLILTSNCLCYEQYSPGEYSNSDISLRMRFATLEQCKQFIPVDKQAEVIQKLMTLN